MLGQVAPRTPTEQAVTAIWQEILALDVPPDIHANFFTLGGHSLLLTQIGSRVAARSDLEIPLQTFFADPTIAALAAWLDHRQWQHTMDPNSLEREEILI